MPEEEDFGRAAKQMRDAMATRPLDERVGLWWYWHGNQLVQQLQHFNDGEYDLVTVLEQVLLQDRKLEKFGAAYAIEEGEAEALVAYFVSLYAEDPNCLRLVLTTWLFIPSTTVRRSGGVLLHPHHVRLCHL